jgi:uncharacterized Tic20 family protein
MARAQYNPGSFRYEEIVMEENNFETSETATPSKSERQWAMACHLIALTGYLIPIAGIVAPLILWLMKREDGAFINEQGRESVNFQITILIYFVISIILIPALGVGVFLLGVVVVFDFVCILIAAVKASEGTAFQYPACIRFIK